MKKLMLSALAVSMMFVSCSKDDDKQMKDTKAEFVQEQLKANESYNEKVNSKEEIPATSKEKFTSWLTEWKNALKSNASKGKAGIMMYQKDGKDAYRVFSGKGFEYEQLIKKGMIGAYQLNGAIGESKKVMSADANNQEILDKVATYLIGGPKNIDNTKVDLESHGKKFKGYKVIPEDNEFAKYLNVVAMDEDFSSISDDLYTAFKEAKANVESSSFSSDILKIIGIAQKVVAVRGVHYLAAGADELGATLEAGAAHEISEGLGFVYSLQFTYMFATTHSHSDHKPAYTGDEVEAFLNDLNLWDTSAKTKLQEKAEQIAGKFKFTVEQAKN